MGSALILLKQLQNVTVNCLLTEGINFSIGKLYVIGGSDGAHSLCTTEIYDPETNTWMPGPSMTTCRANVGVAVVNGRLYAVGGFSGEFRGNVNFFFTPYL